MVRLESFIQTFTKFQDFWREFNDDIFYYDCVKTSAKKNYLVRILVVMF